MVSTLRQRALQSRDAIELRVLISVKEPAEQARMLREQAKEVGLKTCALADTLEKSSGGGIAP